MTKVPRRQTPVKNTSIRGFRPVKDEELHFDTESTPKGERLFMYFVSRSEEGLEKAEKKSDRTTPSHSVILNIRMSA